MCVCVCVCEGVCECVCVCVGVCVCNSPMYMYNDYIDSKFTLQGQTRISVITTWGEAWKKFWRLQV